MSTALLLVLAVAAADAVTVTPDGPPAVTPLQAPDGVKGLRAVFDVRGDPDVVLETLWDVRRFRTIFPDIKALEVLAPSMKELEGAARIDVRFFVDAVFKDVSYTLRRTVDRSKRTVTWEAIAGDLKVARGSWSVAALAVDPAAPTAPRSRVIYTSFVDVGYFVPTGVIRDVAMGKVSEMAGRVRAACASAHAR